MNDLSSSVDKVYDIMEVYSKCGTTKFSDLKNCIMDEYLLWKREEDAEEMTLEEVCEALGRKIKIKED